ncbi:DUF4442 domain-containing protein [Aureisphaera galaxeae]|uniref:DUF4442 domain-containing protein n=1 Tax=Aureisphaera galaxeae TaxID=1538023 RepID=UPI0023504E9A|nr:DUF4442 domain-containing protein [Aureisphaera galaxeae]MDC8003520.1 DUF4442 domain-containing protein [Aureisphaera galaxeae]
MPLKPSQINKFTMFKLPSAYFAGVRAKEISEAHCVTSVKHKWINQNPFKSMFWAVQGMAAELSTGALVMSYIRENKARVSMLVANNKATFSKKAKGRITFLCEDGLKIKEAIEKTVETGEGVTCWMKAVGKDRDGDIVSEFEFEWTVKRKS